MNLYGQGKIGKRTTVGSFTDIGGTVGDDCSIQALVSIPPGTVIEDNVFIGPGVHIANDKYPISHKKDFTPQGTLIKRGANIGMGALIGPGLVIGEGATIGMGAVVLTDVPPGEIWVGNPARKL